MTRDEFVRIYSELDSLCDWSWKRRVECYQNNNTAEARYFCGYEAALEKIKKLMLETEQGAEYATESIRKIRSRYHKREE